MGPTLDRDCTRIVTLADGRAFPALDVGERDAPMVLLLHGFPQGRWAWREIAPRLAEAGFRAVAPDQRGYAPAVRPHAAEEYTVDRAADDALLIVDAVLGDEALSRPFHVVGHDWGGMVAWYLAGWYPERVAGVTVLSTPHPAALLAALPRSTQALRLLYASFFNIPVLPERVLLAGQGAVLRSTLRASGLPARAATKYTAHMREPGALHGALNWYRAVLRAPAAFVPPSSVPTLYVWSSRDVALGRRAAEATAGQVTGPYRFVPLEGVSHWIPETASDRVVPLLLEHLERHPSIEPARTRA